MKNITNCTTAQLHNCNKIASYYVLIVTVVALLFAANLQAQQYPAEEGYAFEDALYFYKWINQEYPPLPDVKINGEWVTWEEAYGPLPTRPPTLIKRPKNPPLKPKLIFNPMDAKSVERFVTKTLTRGEEGAVSFLNLGAEARKETESEDFAGYFRPTQRGGAFSNLFKKEVSTCAVLSEDVLTKSAGLSVSTNLVFHYFGKKEYFLTNSNFIFTDYLIGIENIPTSGKVEVFFTEDLSDGKWYLAPISCIYSVVIENNVYEIPAVTVEGLHSKAFFCASLVSDSDEDGISDVAEVLLFKSDPNDPDSNFLRDENADGAPDFTGKSNNWVCDGDEDLDGDGWSNAQELFMGTNPFVAQNNNLDADNDGLPDWAEKLVATFIRLPNDEFNNPQFPNPNPYSHSDGDGVNDFTELALGTDPSYYDAVYNQSESTARFSTLSGSQSAFVLDPIVVQRTSSGTNSTNSLILESMNILGSYLHMEVVRNYGTNGYDAILLAGAYLDLTPATNWLCISSIATGSESPELLRCSLNSLASLMGSGFHLLSDIWVEADVAGSLDQLSLAEIDLIIKRSFWREIILMRHLQWECELGVGLAQQRPVARKKMYRIIADIITEVTIQKEALARRTSLAGPFYDTLFGTTLQFGAGFFSIVNAVNVPPGLIESVEDYIGSVRQKSDPGAANTLLLAYQIQTYLVDITGSGWLAAFNYYYYLASILMNFEGCEPLF